MTVKMLLLIALLGPIIILAAGYGASARGSRKRNEP
jgi:hypothetical protein